MINTIIAGWQTRRHQDFLDQYPQASEYVMALEYSKREAQNRGIRTADIVAGNVTQEHYDAVTVRPVYTPEVVDMLATMTGLVKLKYGNSDPAIWALIQKAEAAIGESFLEAAETRAA